MQSHRVIRPSCPCRRCLQRSCYRKLNKNLVTKAKGRTYLRVGFTYFYSMNERLELQGVLLHAGMSQEAIDLSGPYWMPKAYKKGEYYNEYKNICKHLGFVLDGVFRIYRANPETGEEKNMMFFTNNQFVASYKS